MKRIGRRHLIRGALQKSDFEKVYRLMDVPAIKGNCGSLCGSKCCQEYEPGVGMYLLPGEECMFTGDEPWLTWKYRLARNHDFPPEWKGLVQFVICDATCPREKRPIQCRTFPLAPYLDLEGNLGVTLDTLSGSLICPLVRKGDFDALQPEFMENVLEAWHILIKDPLIRADVARQSRRLDEDRNAPWRNLLQ